MPMSPYIKGESAFDPADLKAMSIAFDGMCAALKLNQDARARETVAARIIELASRGEHSPTKLRDRLLQEACGGERDVTRSGSTPQPGSLIS
jgi:hypothetical protein